MTERHSFLSAIRESPDDDTPRLVYADWLEEHGEPERAELVRVQVELASRYFIPHRFESDMPKHDRRCARKHVVRTFEKQGMCERCRMLRENHEWVGRNDRLRRRERELVDALGYRDAWQEVAFTLTRGILIELAHCPWERWRSHGDLIWERELPWRVRLVTRRSEPGTEILNEQVGDNEVPATSHGFHLRPEWMKTLLSRRWPGTDFELPGVTAADVEAVLVERANA